MQLKPIETLYKGILFRSRLEARWAVFLDAMGIRYRYEPEGFEEDNGVRYLPDFFLPQVYAMNCEDELPGIYMEVKGVFDEKSRSKIAMFNAPLFLVGGIPESFIKWREDHCAPFFTGEYLNPSKRGTRAFPFCFNPLIDKADACMWAMWNYDEDRAAIDRNYDAEIIRRRTDDALAASRAARFETWDRDKIKFYAPDRLRGQVGGVPFDFPRTKTLFGNLAAIKAITGCTAHEALDAFLEAGGRIDNAGP